MHIVSGVICHQHHHHNVCCLCDVLMVKIPLLAPLSHCCGPPTLSLTYKIVCHFNISLSYYYLQKNVRTWEGSSTTLSVCSHIYN